MGDLASVSAVTVQPSDRRVQYWTFADVTHDDDRKLTSLLSLSHDLTFIAARPLGWERAKTLGHVHVGAPELYEVLEGSAAFLVQDLGPGPSATFVALIEAEAGECVVIPPWAHHVTINTGTTTLVVANVISRRADHDYARLQAARGTAYHLRTDGEVAANPTYLSAPPMTRVSAREWSDAGRDGPIYQTLIETPLRLMWLDDDDGFTSRFAELARRLSVRGGRESTRSASWGAQERR